MNKEYQIQLVVETAKRLAADDNQAAASCLYNVAAALSCNAEHLLAANNCKYMATVLGHNPED